MTLLTDKRIRKLRAACSNGNTSLRNEILLEGALIQWEALMTFERRQARWRAKQERKEVKREEEKRRYQAERLKQERLEIKRRELREKKRKQAEFLSGVIQLIT